MNAPAAAPLEGNPLITAVRVWDGGDPAVPRCMLPTGVEPHKAIDLIAEKGQMQGTSLERLGEIAARICYDSLGTGRPSADFHANILKVNHLSVYEHCVFTIGVEVPCSELDKFLTDCLNRPSLFVRTIPIGSPHGMHGAPYVQIQLTLNLRHVLEWGGDTALSRIVKAYGGTAAPVVVRDNQGTGGGLHTQWIEPTLPQQQWITLLMTGSRGFSHELVRHGDWTAISQRSTRYVDENESPWVQHPLESHFNGCADNGSDRLVRAAQAQYVETKNALEAMLIAKGVDKFTARKQARGAARGYLGNALLTEVVFSASVAQWKHMLRMRACQAADAEIREAFCKALPELQGSRYGAAFAHLTLAPSPDGVGQVVVEG